MKLYKFVGGKYNGLVCEEDRAKRIHRIDGNGFNEDYSEKRKEGICVRRAELDNEYRFNGYFGPMWDGLAYLVDGSLKSSWACTDEEKKNPEYCILRYETPEVYDMLSR